MKKRKLCGFMGKTLESPFGPFNGKKNVFTIVLF